MNSTHPLVWLAVGIIISNIVELIYLLIQRQQYRKKLDLFEQEIKKSQAELTNVVACMHQGGMEFRQQQLRIRELEAALRDVNASFLNLIPHGEPDSPDACWAYGPIQRQIQAASARIISALYGDEPFVREPKAPKPATTQEFVQELDQNGAVEGPRYRTSFDDIKQD